MRFEPHKYPRMSGEMGPTNPEKTQQGKLGASWKRGKAVFEERPGAMYLLSGRPQSTEAVKHIKPQARASGSCAHLCPDGSE